MINYLPDGNQLSRYDNLTQSAGASRNTQKKRNGNTSQTNFPKARSKTRIRRKEKKDLICWLMKDYCLLL